MKYFACSFKLAKVSHLTLTKLTRFRRKNQLRSDEWLNDFFNGFCITPLKLCEQIFVPNLKKNSFKNIDNQFLIKEICCVNNHDKYNPLYEETNKTHN